MPVTLETINQASEQDLIDLEKVYADYPSDFRWPQMQKILQQDDQICLYGARFNARLLGAISCKKTNDHLELNHLCVRKVTRQRHVARDLLRLLIAENPQQKIIFNSCIDEPGLTRLLEQAGFSAENQQYTLQT